MTGRSRFVFLLCISFLFTVSTGTVMACGGGGPLTISGALNMSDYMVRVVVTEVDDLEQNAIVRVESYLAGGPGPRYLLLNRNDPTLVRYRLSGRSSGGDCIGLYSKLAPGDSFYAFVARNVDGSYSIVDTLFSTGYFPFSSPESTFEVFLEGMQQNENFAERGTGQEVTEAELIEIIAQESGETPTPPDTASPYPLYAPLWISTDAASDNLYMLPVDYGDPVPESGETGMLSNNPLWSLGFLDAGSCSTENCIQISPDNLSIAVQADADTIRFAWDHSVTGQAVLFSATSDAVAVWDHCDLNIFTTGYPRLSQDWYELDSLNTTVLEPPSDCQVFSRMAAWSSDGRILAYSDARGLWLWDVYTADTAPRLFIPSEDGTVPAPRYFSPLGRYLNVSFGDVRFTIDIVTGTHFPDGLISPDDRILLSYDSTSLPADLEICSLTPFNCQAVAMYVEHLDENGERLWLYDTRQINRVAWKNYSQFFAMTCVPDVPDQCSIFRWQPDQLGWELPTLVDRGYDFDYDAGNHQLVIVENSSSISIGGQTVDLSQDIDGAIVKVAWMPSLFYRD